ncbi:MAG: VCBS repeat-containing protein [Planctomycetota bacterium]
MHMHPNSSILLTGLFCAGLSAQQQFVPTSSLNASSLPFLPTSGRTVVAAGDLDGDGDMDLVAGLDPAPFSGPSILLLRNGVLAGGISEAYGAFSNWSPPSITRRDRIFDIDVFDADNDGDQDILYVTDTVVGASTLTQVALLRQVSPGVFSAPQFVYATQTSIPLTAEIADMNGDGRLDVVIGLAPALGQAGAGVVLLTNNGLGFTSTVLGPAYPGMWAAAIAIADIDGDGDLDIVTGNVAGQGGNPQNALYRNTGFGFAPTTVGMPFNAVDTQDVLLVDLTGTPLPELVVIDRNSTKTVHGNLGGTFGPAIATFTAGGFGSSNSGAAADIDGDGDNDLVFGNAGTNTQVIVNNFGALVSTPTRITADGASASTLLVDLDRDQDLDLVQGTSNAATSGVRAQINLHRQIDLPTTVRIGTTLVHDWYDRPGYGNGHTPTLFLSPAPWVPRVEFAPFGFAGVDLTLASVSTLAPAPSGKNSVPLNVPNTPGLIGQTFYWQWMIQPNGSPTTAWGLTNVVPLTFLP